MKTFKETFEEWMNKKVDNQLSEIDKIATELDFDTKKWFEFYRRRNGDYSGTEFLENLLSDFTFHISREFQKILCQYVTPKWYNIYNEPYLGFCIDYESGNFFLNKGDKKILKKLFKQLTIEQKQELSKNKLFSYILDKTKAKLISKREVRFLKLNIINGYSETSKE